MTPFDPRLPIIAAEARVKTCHVFHCWQAMREMGKKFHATAFAQFSGLEGRHVAAIIAALEAHDALPDKRSVITTRGQRLADDFIAPDAWIDLAVKERRWTPDDAKIEAENFANYWQGKSGKDAAKLDWRKTWINWYRNSRRPDGDYQQEISAYTSPREHMERTLSLYERMGRTQEAAEIRAKLECLGAEVIPINRKSA